jgi:chromosome segregation ATPase
MTSAMLQRQNVNLQASLAQTRQRLNESEAQLRTASGALAAREQSLSVFQRQWEQLETQLALSLASLGADVPAVSGEAPAAAQEALLRMATPVEALAGAIDDVDAAVQARCARMLEMGKSLAGPLAAARAGGGGGAGGGGAEAAEAAPLVARLQAERAPLSA